MSACTVVAFLLLNVLEANFEVNQLSSLSLNIWIIDSITNSFTEDSGFLWNKAGFYFQTSTEQLMWVMEQMSRICSFQQEKNTVEYGAASLLPLRWNLQTPVHLRVPHYSLRTCSHTETRVQVDRSTTLNLKIQKWFRAENKHSLS